MTDVKAELIRKIESTRRLLNESIDTREAYDIIYHHSAELDGLLNRYIKMETEEKQIRKLAL